MRNTTFAYHSIHSLVAWRQTHQTQRIYLRLLIPFKPSNIQSRTMAPNPPNPTHLFSATNPLQALLYSIAQHLRTASSNSTSSNLLQNIYFKSRSSIRHPVKFSYCPAGSFLAIETRNFRYHPMTTRPAPDSIINTI